MEDDFTTNKKRMFSRNFVLIVIAALIFLSLFVSITFMITRAVFGLLFVLFVPGFIASYAFFRKDEIDLIERVALSIGLSISLVVLTVMFSNLYLKIPINLETILIEISSVCGFFLIVVYLQRLRVLPRFTGMLGVMTETSKKKIFIIAGAGIVILLLAVDILYPFIKFPTETPSSQDVIDRDYSFEKLYNSSMTVYDFYPQKNIAKNLTNVTIPMPFLEVFDDKIALLGYDMDKTELKPGGNLHVTYFWKSLEEVNTSYNALVHFTDVDGKVIFQQNHMPTLPSGLVAYGIIDDMEGKIGWKSVGSRKNSADISNDSSYVMEGKKSLKVIYHIDNSTENDWVFIRKVYGTPQDFSDYKNISFWVYAEENISNFWIKIGEMNNSIYRYNPTLKTGWNHISVSLSQFKLATWTKDNGIFDLDQIKYIEIGFEDPRPSKPLVFSLYIDDLRLINEEGQRISLYKPYLTSKWNPGDIIMEEFDVKIPSYVPEGTYFIRVGLQDENGNKIPIVYGQFIDIDNRAIIGRITVTK
jgi:hypothetical protein